MEAISIKKVGPYNISPTVLGSGSFAKVHLAHDTHNCFLAAKVIPIDQLDKQQISSLEAQINILKKCRHENVVAFVDAKKTKNNLYIFMEYCQEGTLQEYIKKKGKLDQKEAIQIFQQVAKGMRVLTACKVLHRDIKPANILLSKGKVKIADFGLAKRFLNGQLHRTYAGSPYHMAPQILKREEYSQKVDVYSAGTVLFQMLFGAVPFKGKDHSDLAKSIQKGLKENQMICLSKDIKQFLLDMLQPNPQKRLDMNGVTDFLEAYFRQQGRKKIQNYRKMSLMNLNGMAVMGAILSSFSFLQKPKISPSNMDLCLYGRLYKRLNQINV